jgi:TRAP-type C4-dicarboxylate transport system permease small subunit
MTETSERREPVNGWRKMIHLYDRVLSIIEYLFIIIAAILLAVMILIITYSVLGRSLFGLQGAWTVEVSEYAMLYLTFLAAPWVLKQQGHVRVDIAISALSPRIRATLIYITSFVAACACLILFWFSLLTTVDYYQRGVTLLQALQIPQYLVLAAIPLGSLFLFLRFICELLKAYGARNSEGEIGQEHGPEH